MPGVNLFDDQTPYSSEAGALASGFGSAPLKGWKDFGSRLKQGLKNLGGYRSTDTLVAGPQKLGEEYARISEEGLYTEDDIQDIFGQTRKSLGADRRAQARGMRRNLGRRLGSRSGAVETLTANQSARTRAALAQLLVQLRQRNLETRQLGLQGQFNIMSFLENREQNRLNREAGEGGGIGLLDLVGGVAPIVGGLLGGPAGAAAGGAVNKGRGWS